MSRRRRHWLIGLAAGLLLLLVLIGGNTARNAARLQPLQNTPAELLARLSNDWRLVRPDGPGPHPAALLLSGCDGVHDNMEYWAGVMADAGRAALIIDSHTPRGFDRLQSWRAICAGQVLTGAERAADIAVALQALRGMPGIDAEDVALLGASHGGWAVMEFMQLAAEADAPPPGLEEWPAPPLESLAQVGPVVLLYPYCGWASGAGAARWPKNNRGLMVLAGEDSIVSPQSCREMADTLAAKGANLELLTIADADHGFDQQERSALSSLDFNEGQRAIATAAVKRLLATQAPQKPQASRR